MTFDEFIIYSVLIGSVVVFGGAAVLALAWAVRDGQFENFERSARTIFDPDEPIGEATDYFPDVAHQPAGAAGAPAASSNGNSGSHARH